jgi:hypothetical protein
VLKIVQAAVALGVDEIVIRVTRRELLLSFACLSEELACPTTITASLADPLAASGVALRHLLLGLAAAGAEKDLEVLWQSPRGSLRLAAGTVENLAETQPVYRLVARRARPLWRWFLGSLFHRETLHLSQRCGFLPARLVLDGLEAPRPAWGRFGTDVPLQLGPTRPTMLLDHRVPGQGLELAYPPSDCYTEGSPSRPWKGAPSSPGLPKKATVPLLLSGWDGCLTMPARGAVGIPWAAHGPGRVIPVAHGVQLQPIEVEDLGLPGAQILMDVSDLSQGSQGLELARDERWEGRLEEARGWVREARLALRPAELRQALLASGLAESEVEPLLSQTWRALDGAAVAPGLLSLVHRCFGDSEMLLGARLVAGRMSDLRTALGPLLSPDEVLLGLLDSAFLSTLAITDRKLCSPGFMVSEYVYWDELREVGFKPIEGGIEVLRSTILAPAESKDALITFVEQVVKLPLPPSYPCTPAEETVLRTALKTLGRPSGITYYPHLPESEVLLERKLHGARWPASERALVMGEHCEYRGWIATTRRFLWRNPPIPGRLRHSPPIVERPDMVEWTAFTADQVQSSGYDVEIGRRKVSSLHDNLRQPLVEFLRGMAGGQA